MKTDEEIAQLAIDMANGQVFTSLHLEPGDSMLNMVFLPLALMSPEDQKDWLATEPHIIFEYLEKAGPRSVNGLPVFFSFQSLNKEETEKLRVKLREVLEFQGRLRGRKDDHSGSSGKREV